MFTYYPFGVVLRITLEIIVVVIALFKRDYLQCMIVDIKSILIGV